MQPGYNQGHSTFRNQPSYTIFNKSFEDANDVLFLQLNEIDPFFLSDQQLQNVNGFQQDDIIDPRTKKKLECTTYNHTDNGNSCRLFKGAGLKSTLTKKQQETCLRVLLGWQERKEIDEIDLIVWRQMEGKIRKEREQMQKFISEYAEANKEDIYAPTKRLEEYYRNWYKRKTNLLIQQNPENLTFNTHTGLPHVSVCRSTNDDKAEICDVQLLAKSGWLRIHAEDEQIEWKNFNFRLEEYAEAFNGAMELSIEEEKNLVESQLNDFEDQEISRNCYIPFDTILFLLTAGNYVDLPTECLLEINHTSADSNKIIQFDKPFPARNCGWHTQQQVVEQSFAAFLSVKGRSKWLHVEKENVKPEILITPQIHAVMQEQSEFKPQTVDRFLKHHHAIAEGSNVKINTAVVKWYLRTPDPFESLKILTTFSLPPTLNEQAKEFYLHETIKLEYKSQFGCELLTKYELLRIWLKIKLMTFSKTTGYGFCYRLSTTDCGLQLRERLTLEVVEHQLKNSYHVNPVQLVANLAEFLKLLFHMPSGKYMLRYNSKYKDKFLLCAPSFEITQNTINLHSLLQADPTDMLFMTQAQYLPILETLCSRVHLRYRILPCAFLPQLSHQKNLQTASSRAKAKTVILQKKRASEDKAVKLEKSKAELLATKRRNQKRLRRRQKKLATKKKELEQEAETNKLLSF